MTRARWILISLAAVFALSACGGFSIRPPRASRSVVFAGFEVVYGNQIPGDRQHLLNQYGVAPQMSLALRSAYPVGTGPIVRVIITQYRAGRWGGAHMGATVQVLDATQRILAQFDVSSRSIRRRRRGNATEAMAQDLVDQIAQRL